MRNCFSYTDPHFFEYLAEQMRFEMRYKNLRRFLLSNSPKTTCIGDMEYFGHLSTITDRVIAHSAEVTRLVDLVPIDLINKALV